MDAAATGRLRRAARALLVLLCCWPVPSAVATEIIFLHSGETVQAEGTQIIGDRVRVTLPAGNTVEIPGSDILSVHPYPSQQPSTGSSNPAETYQGITQQMTDKVRRELMEQSQKTPPK